jgi:hypothetical protein
LTVSNVMCGLVLQHQIEVHDMKDLLGESTGAGGSGNIVPCNLLTVAATGNAGFLEDLLKVGMDPDVGDSKGRTALVITRERTHYFSSFLVPTICFAIHCSCVC